MKRDNAGTHGKRKLLTFNQVVVGSIPTGLTIRIKDLEQIATSIKKFRHAAVTLTQPGA